MSISRHEARHQALNVLFAADVRGVSASTLLEKTGSMSPVSGPVATDAKIMVALYEDNRKQIDRMIASHADGWMLKRMAGVDRNAMRLAIAEMVFGDVPVEIAINEAVNLVGELGGPDSPRFVNGVLGAIQRELQAQAEAEIAQHPASGTGDGQPANPSDADAPIDWSTPETSPPTRTSGHGELATLADAHPEPTSPGVQSDEESHTLPMAPRDHAVLQGAPDRHQDEPVVVSELVETQPDQQHPEPPAEADPEGQ